LPKCKFTTKYFDYEISVEVDFNCQEEELLASGLCIFHDKDYLQDKTNYEEHKMKVLDRLKHKVNHAISNNEPLLCIGFQLPDFSLSDLSIISKEFTKPVYFNGSQFFGKASFSKANFQGEADFPLAKFQGKADFPLAKFQGKASFPLAKFQGGAWFSEANFQGEADFERAQFLRGVLFSVANFQGEAYFARAKFQLRADFSRAKFEGEAFFYGAKFEGEADFHETSFEEAYFSTTEFKGLTNFQYVNFGDEDKILFDRTDLSNVSFNCTDISRIRFGGNVEWGGKKVKEDEFKIVDERQLEKEIKEKDGHTTKDSNLGLGSIIGIYRDLKENYEKRHRYEYAAKFHIREMELQRKYREVQSEEENNSLEIKQNNWFRRNLLSLTGWYYNLSRYGEDYTRPLLVALSILLISTIYWSMQTDPATLHPKYSGPSQLGDLTHIQKAFERSLASFYQTTYDDKFVLADYLIRTISLIFIGILFVEAIRRRVRS
jgi:uncharacterized protein YjbI with pentapeptide repeats